MYYVGTEGDAVWLRQCAIRTIALQSTGVYWIAVYDILEEAGFEVYLVNAKETKNLPGRKSDVQESQWLMAAHLWSAEELVSALSSNPHDADLLAAAP